MWRSFLGRARLLPVLPFAIPWHTLAFLVKEISFQSFKRASVCFADQRYLFCVWLNNFFFSCANWRACFFLLILLHSHCFLFLICQVILKRWWDLIIQPRKTLYVFSVFTIALILTVIWSHFFSRKYTQSFYWKESQNQTNLMKYEENLISTH